MKNMDLELDKLLEEIEVENKRADIKTRTHSAGVR